jgi:hypothetical protein
VNKGGSDSELSDAKHQCPVTQNQLRQAMGVTSETDVISMHTFKLNLEPSFEQEPISVNNVLGKRSSTNPAIPPIKHLCTSAHQEDLAPSAFLVGCKWSSEHWSCTYYSAFMILFPIYHNVPPSWRLLWSAGTTAQEHLGRTFEHLLMSDANLFNQQLYNNHCYLFCDLLNAHDSAIFPHFGARMTAVSVVLEHTCPEPNLCLQIDGQSMGNAGELNFRLPVYCAPFDCLGNSEALLSLQVWLKLWFARQKEKLIRMHEDVLHDRDDAVSSSTVEITMADVPPVLFFKLGPSDLPAVVLSNSLDLPSGSGMVEYYLKGIIYGGGGHFTVRLFAEHGLWSYNGQVNGGRPCFKGQSIDLLHLHEFDGRKAHLGIYALKSSNPIPTTAQHPSQLQQLNHTTM